MPDFSIVPSSHGLTWKQLAISIKNQTTEHHLMIFAGNLAFRSLLAIFPLFVLLLSLLGVFHATDFVTSALDSADGVLPAEAISLIRDQLLDITQATASSTFTIGAIVSVLVALWAVSGMARVVMKSFNVMYGVHETRGVIRRYVTSVVLALVEVVLVIVALALVGVSSGPAHAIGDWIRLGDGVVLAWEIVRWPLVAIVIMTALELLYWVAPNVDHSYRPISVGGGTASVLWILFSLAFALYVNNFGSYNATYGAFTGIIVLLFYAMFTAAIVLLGAEINHVVDGPTRRQKARRFWRRLRD